MKQNEIWLINPDPAIGAEIKKTRPAIIINDHASGKMLLKIIVPITDWKHRYQIAPGVIRILPSHENGLTRLYSIDCFKIRSVSETRFVRKLSAIGETIHEKIKIPLSKVLSIL